MPVQLTPPGVLNGPYGKPYIDGRPLQIVDESTLQEVEPDLGELTVAVGIATVLHNWCPDALYAFVDLQAWFSLTWNLTIGQGEAHETKFEVSRIRSQVTFGKLDKDGLWERLISYDIQESEDFPSGGGVWVPNAEETMIGEENVSDVDEVERLGNSFIQDLIAQKRWQTGRKMKHEFFVEPTGAPIDAFGDGIAMNPHWLYHGLDLSKCTTCGKSGPLSRCGKCGTAAYCSSTCQTLDWQVHKGVCSMAMEDRGKALHLSKNGGLIQWDWSAGSVDELVAATGEGNEFLQAASLAHT